MSINAFFKVDYDVLRNLLGLPDSVNIQAVRTDIGRKKLHVFVEDVNGPEVDPLLEVREVYPVGKHDDQNRVVLLWDEVWAEPESEEQVAEE